MALRDDTIEVRLLDEELKRELELDVEDFVLVGEIVLYLGDEMEV